MTRQPKRVKGRQPSTGRQGKGPKKLSERHLRFIDEYVKDCNGTEAYLRAGYKVTRKSAGVLASGLLANAQIRDKIDQRLQKIRDSREKESEAFLKHTMAVATSDIRQAFDQEGNLLPVHLWPDELALAVSGLDVETIRRAGEGDDDAQEKIVKKLRLWNKPQALDLLGRFAGVLSANKETARVVVRIRDYTGREVAVGIESE